MLIIRQVLIKMLFLYLFLGAAVGVALFEIEGFLPGVLLGYLSYQDNLKRQQIKTLHTKLGILHNRLRQLKEKEEQELFDQVPEEGSEFLEQVEETGTRDMVEEQGEQEVHEPEQVVLEEDDEPASQEADQITKHTDSIPVNVWDNVRSFVMQGNWLLLSGIAVLFIGLSLLVRLAIENELFPIELRLILVAVAGGVLVFIGSRLVDKRPQYGFVLEGGGLAILYLTIFASFRLYELLPEPIATALLMAVTLFGVLLGLGQNAQWVSIVSMLGGFCVPILINSEQGNHVMLFSYYAILNVGILTTAWYKAWRYLNITGFICTFGLGTFWGGLYYKPELFASTEPFLILFFAIYLGISMLYTLRHDGSVRHAVDGTLVFGLPVVVFVLQASLVEPFTYGIAISSALLGLCYLGTAHWLRFRKNEKVDLLIESFDGIGIALVSLFVPFIFDTMWTGIGWAIEGAALVWLGMRQQRVLVRFSGYMLVIGASIVFLLGFADVSGWGYMALSLALCLTAYWVNAHKETLTAIERYIEPVTLYAGLLFWLVGGGIEIEERLSSPQFIQGWVAYSGLTALICGFVGHAFSWKEIARSSLFNVPVLIVLVVIASIEGHPFAYWGGLAWPLALVATYASLLLIESHVSTRVLGRAHAVYVWVIVVLGSSEGFWLADEFLGANSAWPLVGWLFFPITIVFAVSWFSQQNIWPFDVHKKAYLREALFPVIVITALVSIGGSFGNDGDGIYAMYLPLLNPLDVVLIGFVFVMIFWYRRIHQESLATSALLQRGVLVWNLVALLFIWMNATIARTVHHWGDVPYNEAMWDSEVFQTALSICWTLLAVTTMAVVARRGIRTTWIVAASLLAVVVIKLFVVDLSSLSTVPRIISFIGVGVLLLVIGYIAPVPPKKREEVPGTETV